MLSIKLFRLVFCLFRFNRNIKTICFGTEAKQPKQTVSKQTKTNRNKPKQPLNFLKKCQNMLSIKLFGLLFCLFRFNQNTETLCFGIEAKQPKQTFCFGSKLVLKDTLSTLILYLTLDWMAKWMPAGR